MATPSLWQLQHPGRTVPPLDGPVDADVCVVGAGITGCACAWRLLEHGIRPAIVDGRRAAGGASGRNGGFAVTDSSLDPVELAPGWAPTGLVGCSPQFASSWTG